MRDRFESNVVTFFLCGAILFATALALGAIGIQWVQCKVRRPR